MHIELWKSFLQPLRMKLLIYNMLLISLQSTAYLMKECWVGSLERWTVRASTASDMVVVMALLFGHLDGKEQTAGGF
jgi:hypothetical protein